MMWTTVAANQETPQKYKLDFFLGDKLAQLIVVKMQWSPLKVGLLALGFAWLLSIVMALATGTLLPNPSITALLEDYVYMITETAVVPVIWGYYIWICTAPVRVLNKLEAREVVAPQEDDIRKASDVLRSHFPTYLAAILAVVVGVSYYVTIFLAPPQWLNTSATFLALRVMLVITPGAFVTWSIALRVLIYARVFRRILKNVAVHPLHPDRAGGLYPLGQYALRTTYLIALGGSVIALLGYQSYLWGELKTAYFVYMAFVPYLVTAPLAFFLPLSSVHTAMRQAKEDLLLEIANQFNCDFLLAYDERSGSAKDLKDNLEKIEQLQALHKVVMTFPVWPFDTGTIRRYFVAMSSPLITIAASALISSIDKLIA